MNRTTLYSLIFVLLMAALTTPMHAQTGKTVQKTTVAATDTSKAAIEQKAIRKVFDEFIQAYSLVEKTKNKQGVLKYMAPEVISTLVSFNVNEKMNIAYSDYNGFAAYLDKLLATAGLEVDYRVANIDKVYLHNNVGVLVYGVNYDIKKNGQSWAKGHENVSLTYKKIGGEWKIVQYTVTAIEDAKLKAPCECEIYGDNTGEYVVKTVIPNGRSYTTELNPVGFMKMDKGQIVAIGNSYYQWLDNGDVYFKVSNGAEINSSDEKIGSMAGTEKKDIIHLILKQHLYTDQCGELKIEKTN